MASPICNDLIAAIGKSQLKVMLHASALYKCFISLGKRSNLWETTVLDYYRQTNKWCSGTSRDNKEVFSFFF